MICRISPPCMSKNCTDSLRDVEWAGKLPMDIRQSGLCSVCKAASGSRKQYRNVSDEWKERLKRSLFFYWIFSVSIRERAAISSIIRELMYPPLTAAQIAEHLEDFIDRIKLFACIDTLEYLVKGGRLSKVAGNIGSMLNIKPIIAFDDVGNIKVIKKVAGSKKAFSDLCGRIAETDIDTNYPVIPLFACSDANCRKMLGMLEETENFPSNLIPEEIGATIGPYIGPGGFGLTFVEKAKA